MEIISSRQNKYIKHLKALSSDRAYRGSRGEYICDGEKLLEECMKCGAEVTSVLWSGERTLDLPPNIEQFWADKELLKYVSSLKETAGPLFTVRKRTMRLEGEISRAIVLDKVQDPGNVGTVIRTARAFGIDAVIPINGCADPYNHKTVRSAMGALFSQCVLEMSVDEAVALFRERGIPLYGAALSETAADARHFDLRRSAVAIGNEGNGLSAELIEKCDGLLVIPMNGDVQSLNAAISAAIVMWEMVR